MSERVSIKSLARDLGVSHMTVSRALAGHPGVQAETRATIVAAAEAQGYTRSPAGAALRGSATRILGLVVPGLVNEFYARLAHALSILAADRGYHLVTHLTGDDPEREGTALRKLAALRAEAVALVPAPGGPTPPPLPIVHLVRRGEPPGLFVGIEDTGPIRDAVRHLVARGRRRIAYVGGAGTTSTGRDRLGAVMAGLREAGLGTDLMRLGSPRVEFGREALRELLAGDPDAVVCGGVEVTAGALEVCLEERLAVAGRFAFVGYGDPVAFRWLAGGITTLALPIEEVATRTFAALTTGVEFPDQPQAALILRATA